MIWRDSTSEMGGRGSVTGFEPRFTPELIDVDFSNRIRAKIDACAGHHCGGRGT